MKTNFLLVLSLVAITLMSCKNTPKNQAETTEAKKVETSEGQKVNIDVTKSTINWTGSKPGGSHHGTLALKSGSVIVKDSKLIGGDFILDMDNIVCSDLEGEMNTKLVDHLKSADFFNVEKFPEGKFVITDVKYDSTGVDCVISGNLSLKDVEKNISFKASTTNVEGKGVANTETFSIDRTLWGVTYKSKNVFKDLKDTFINDNMEIQISITTE